MSLKAESKKSLPALWFQTYSFKRLVIHSYCLICLRRKCRFLSAETAEICSDGQTFHNESTRHWLQTRSVNKSQARRTDDDDPWQQRGTRCHDIKNNQTVPDQSIRYQSQHQKYPQQCNLLRVKDMNDSSFIADFQFWGKLKVVKLQSIRETAAPCVFTRGTCHDIPWNQNSIATLVWNQERF